MEMELFDENPEANAANRRLGSWRQCWRVAIRVCIALLPSFIQDSAWIQSSVGNMSPTYRYDMIPEARRRTAFLDGMRGLAALCVCLEHFLLPFWENIFYAYGSANGKNLVQLPVIRLLYSGSPMVCIFFAISGVALSLRPFRQMNGAEWPALYRTYSSMIFRRGIRLFLPTTLVSFGFMIVIHFGLCDVQTAVEYNGPPQLLDEFWTKQPVFVQGLWNQLQEWLSFIIAKVLIPATWRATGTGNDYGDLEHVQYGSQLWSIGVEYWSSILLIVLLIGTTGIQSGYKTVIFVILTCLSLGVGRWDLALFIYGSLLAHLVSFEAASSAKAGYHLWLDLLLVIIFCVGLYLASFPELGASQTPGFIWLSTGYNNPRFWQSIGAAIAVSAVSALQFLQKVFRWKLLQYFGHISFSLYLIHIPMLATVGWRLVAVILTLTGRDSDLKYCFGLSVSLLLLLPLVIWAADLLTRFIDKPCICLAHYLEGHLQALPT